MPKFRCVNTGNDIRFFDSHDEAYRFVMSEGDKSRLWSLNAIPTYTITRRHDMKVMATGLAFMQAYGSELDKLNPSEVDYLIHFDDEPAVSQPTPPCPVQAAWAYL